MKLSINTQHEQDFARNVLENSSALIIVLDNKGRICRFNHACENLSGYTLDEVVGKCPWDTVLPLEDAEAIRKNAFYALINNPQALAGTYTNYWLSKNGKKYYLDWTNSLLFDADGNVEYVISVGTDATERQRVEMKLQESERRFRLAVRGSQDGLWDWDVTSSKYYFSPRFKELLGYPPHEESLNRFGDFGSRLHPEDRSRTLDLINLNVLHGTPYSVEFRLKILTGEYRWFLAKGDTTRDESGRPLHMSGSISDITDRIHAQQAVKKQLRYLDVIERISNLCLKADLDDMLGSVLDEMLAIFQCDRAWILFPCDPDAPSWQVPIERTRPEWPGAKVDGIFIPMDEGVAELFSLALKEDVAVRYDLESGRELPKAAKSFSVQSQMTIVIHAKIGKPWLLGIHHCAQPHVYTQDEERIFNDISRIISDALSSLLFVSELQKSEESLNEAQCLSKLGSWDLDLINNEVVWSDEVYRIFGLERNEFGASYNDFLEVVHPDDRNIVNSAYLESVENRIPYDLVHRLLLKDGTLKYVHAKCKTFYDSDGNSMRSIGTIQDITERTRLEEMIGHLTRSQSTSAADVE